MPFESRDGQLYHLIHLSLSMDTVCPILNILYPRWVHNEGKSIRCHFTVLGNGAYTQFIMIL